MKIKQTNCKFKNIRQNSQNNRLLSSQFNSNLWSKFREILKILHIHTCIINVLREKI
jgi:hypothetical protein